MALVPRFLLPSKRSRLEQGVTGDKPPLQTSLPSQSIEKQRESEAPAELAPPWFGRSLTLPSNELVGQSR